MENLKLVRYFSDNFEVRTTFIICQYRKIAAARYMLSVDPIHRTMNARVIKFTFSMLILALDFEIGIRKNMSSLKYF